VLAEDELTEIRKERRLKQKRSSTDMASFRWYLRHEYPIITKKAIEALLPFYTSYLREAGFSEMNTMKKKNRLRLQTLEDDLSVCLSAIQPRTRDTRRPPSTGFPLIFYAYVKTFIFYTCSY
jgi:hypothetical protein